MSIGFWKAPAWDLPTAGAVQVELLKLRNRSIISDDGWPASFWHAVEARRLLKGDEAEQCVELFQGLSVGDPMRCHLPPWGLAFYDKDEALLFTTTLCFECSNAYVHTSSGRVLRAFDVSESHAKELLSMLQHGVVAPIGVTDGV